MHYIGPDLPLDRQVRWSLPLLFRSGFGSRLFVPNYRAVPVPGLRPSFQPDQALIVAAVRPGLRAWETGPVTSAPRLSRLPWVWFTAWLLVGAGYAVSLIGIASIGLFIVPLPVLATVLLVWRQPAASGLPGLISGLGVPFLYVAYLNRAGPGTICSLVTGGQECNDEWSPWPWLAAGVILLVLGVAAFVCRQRRANLRS
jgi:hypothetical protein